MNVVEPLRLATTSVFNRESTMQLHRKPGLARLVTLASVLVFAIAGCGANPLAPFQPEASNVADNFSLQTTGVTNATTTNTYIWANSGTRATINHSTTTQSGTTLLVIKHAAGTTVYSKALSASLNEPSTPVGAAANWTVQLTLTNCSGTVNFRAQKL